MPRGFTRIGRPFLSSETSRERCKQHVAKRTLLTITHLIVGLVQTRRRRPGPQHRRAFWYRAGNSPDSLSYTHSRELHRCSADRGGDLTPFMQPYDNLYKTIGNSYKYNDDLWHEQNPPAYG